ncbi:MAG: DUF2203 domain-containing protein [Planctomycetaceae bacterium]|nr:DUF2203 domain-containing protein [Planctomycetaceae bacterium]
MSEATRAKRKLFSVEQANATLPLVRSIVGDISELSQSILERRERLQLLKRARRRDDDVYADELAQTERDVEVDVKQLKEYIDELTRLGVDLKSAPEGLVDFAGELEGREVCLCWKLGESEVLYWHEVDAGFAGRQPLTVESVAGTANPDSTLLHNPRPGSAKRA